MNTLFAAAMFVCGATAWDAPPTWIGTEMTGTARTECSFTANSTPEFKKLYERLLADLKASPEITKVYSEADLGHPSYTGRVFDLDRTLTREAQEIQMRASVALYHDKTSLHYDAKSQTVKATGAAKNIKELSPDFFLRHLGLGKYKVLFSVKMRVTKPAAISKDRLIHIVEKQTDLELKKAQVDFIPIFISEL